jgi:hypothetical protein
MQKVELTIIIGENAFFKGIKIKGDNHSTE